MPSTLLCSLTTGATLTQHGYACVKRSQKCRQWGVVGRRKADVTINDPAQSHTIPPQPAEQWPDDGSTQNLGQLHEIPTSYVKLPAGLAHVGIKKRSYTIGHPDRAAVWQDDIKEQLDASQLHATGLRFPPIPGLAFVHGMLASNCKQNLGRESRSLA
eukprot:355296-Chlamydomonas_euryale.AAC.1